jgi:hypothetical protein
VPPPETGNKTRLSNTQDITVIGIGKKVYYRRQLMGVTARWTAKGVAVLLDDPIPAHFPAVSEYQTDTIILCADDFTLDGEWRFEK